MTLEAIVTLIRSARFTYSSEAELQAALAALLREAGADVEREVRLDAASRIDLLVGTVGVEVKVAGKADAVLRQLRRYAESYRVEGLVLVTSRVRHRLPELIGRKPLVVVQLAGGAL